VSHSHFFSIFCKSLKRGNRKSYFILFFILFFVMKEKGEEVPSKDKTNLYRTIVPLIKKWLRDKFAGIVGPNISCYSFV